MPKIEASKLNRSLKEVLEGVADGKRYELTRYGKTVAKIVPPTARDPKPEDPTVDYMDHIQKVHDEAAEKRIKAEPSPEVMRQKRRDALLRLLNKSKT